jgi:hypothetical protein
MYNTTTEQEQVRLDLLKKMYNFERGDLIIVNPETDGLVGYFVDTKEILHVLHTDKRDEDRYSDGGFSMILYQKPLEKYIKHIENYEKACENWKKQSKYSAMMRKQGPPNHPKESCADIMIYNINSIQKIPNK